MDFQSDAHPAQLSDESSAWIFFFLPTLTGHTTCRVTSVPHLDRPDHSSVPSEECNFATFSSSVSVRSRRRSCSLKPVRSLRDQQDGRKDTLRLGAVNFHAFQVFQDDHVESVVNDHPSSRCIQNSDLT